MCSRAWNSLLSLFARDGIATALPGRGEYQGAIAAALVSLPVSMTYGIVAFSALGPEFTGTGLIAGIYGAIAVSLLAVPLGSGSLLVSGPRAAAAVVFSAVVAALLELDAVSALGAQATNVAIAGGFATVLLAGLLQALAGRLRVGRLVHYMPAPVIAGFVNASACIILVGQLPQLLGIPDAASLRSVLAEPGLMLSVGTVAGLVTVMLMQFAGRWSRAIPAPLLALAGGVLVYHALAALGPSTGLPAGATLEPVPVGLPQPFLTPELLTWMHPGLLQDALWILLPAAFSMMVLASFETLLSLSALDDRSGSRSNPDVELRAQGLANVGAALVGGVMSSGGLNRTVPLLEAGSRRLSVHALSALVMLGIVTLSYPLLRFVPQAVVSGMIVYLAWSLIDRWSLDLLRSLASSATRRRSSRLVDVLIIVLVVAVALHSGIMPAVGVGILLAVLFFTTTMSRSVVRSVRHGPGIHSRRRWSPERARALEEPARRIAVVELDGVLFFGNAQGLESAIDALAGSGLEYLILDFRRVPDVDTSGARALLRILQRTRRSDIELNFSCIRREPEGVPVDGGERADRLRLGGALEDAGLIDAIGPERLFADTDDALAHCEDALLIRHASGAQADPGLAEALMLRGFDRSDFRALRPRMQRVCFAPDSVLFEQGSAGDAIYLVLRGHAEIRVNGEQGSTGTVVHRLRPGSVFGEMSVLDGEPRAASVHARSALTCYCMRVADFHSLQRTHPKTALRIHGNLALVFASRLRAANALVAELEQ